MIKAIAVDDEPFALEVIRAHAAKTPFLELAGCFTDPFKAIEHMVQQPVDLLFLDIKMPDISGLELMESLQYKPLVIFTTAYAEHAVESYELNAADYLLKPFGFPRFLKACHKAQELLQHKFRKGDEPSGSAFIKSGYELVRVIFSDILYLESAGNYITFIMADRRQILSRLTMGEALSLLPQNIFVRVHRSFVVNKLKVDRIERHQLHMGGQRIPVSSSFTVTL